MYLRYLPLLTLFVSVPALALSFQTPLEKIEWKVEGDKFECRMTQAVTDFGRGQFVQRAGERPIFRLEEHSRWFAGGSATLLAAAAPWQPGRGDINLGQVSVQPGSVPLSSNEEQGGRLLAGMLDGRSPLVRYRGQPSGESLEVRLLPVSINKPYNDFIACTANLLPVNFDQIRKSQLGFSGPGLELIRWRRPSSISFSIMCAPIPVLIALNWTVIRTTAVTDYPIAMSRGAGQWLYRLT